MLSVAHNTWAQGIILLLCVISRASCAPLATEAYITDITPRRIPVTGNTPVTVILSKNVGNTSGQVLCLIANTASGSSLFFNATAAFTGRFQAHSAKEVVCDSVPRVTVEGQGLLQVSVNGGTSWLGGEKHSLSNLCFGAWVGFRFRVRVTVTHVRVFLNQSSVDETSFRSDRFDDVWCGFCGTPKSDDRSTEIPDICL